MSDVNNTEQPWDREWSEQGIKDWNGQVIKEFRANKGKVSGAYEGGKLLLLTTTGARSGKRHTVPLSYLVDGERLIISSLIETTYPAWYHNVKVNSAVTIELGSETFDAVAAVTTGEDREQLWTWVIQQWPDLIEYQAKATRPLPLVVLQRGGV